MEEFPDDFYKTKFVDNERKINYKNRMNKLKQYRKKIHEFIDNNKEQIKNGLIYEFEKFPDSGIIRELINELRVREFKVSSNFDIYRDKQILIIN